MGLDMYLNKKTYIGANYEHRNVTGKVDISIQEENVPIQFNRISYIEENVGYWRKANAIHSWFVNNVQDGIDECQESYVEISDLIELLNTIEKVLENCKLVDGVVENGQIMRPGDTEFKPIYEAGKYIENPQIAHELLPTQSGFFFGGTDYDQWYYQDLLDTKEIIEKVIAEDNKHAEYYYHSSW